MLSLVVFNADFYFLRARIKYYSQPPGLQKPPPYLTEQKIAEMQEGFNLNNLPQENNNTVQGKTVSVIDYH